jgi:hypothetical protein
MKRGAGSPITYIISDFLRNVKQFFVFYAQIYVKIHHSSPSNASSYHTCNLLQKNTTNNNPHCATALGWGGMRGIAKMLFIL